MTADAVIVGTGSGGATAAEVLTRAGWTVVIIDKGTNHLVDPDAPYSLRRDFSNDEIKFVHRHFLGPDPLVEPRTFRTDASCDRTYVGEVNPVPSTVGGGGVHADGKVPRFREEDFALRTAYGPIEGAEVEDWPLRYDEIEPYYAEAERLIGVAGDAAGNPLAAWRSGPYPMEPGPAMMGALRSSAAAHELGLHPYAAPTAANSRPYDGRGACNNCGFCAFFGCPVHAKGDPLALLQRALRTGRAELLDQTCAVRIVRRGRRATGVEVIDDRTGERRVVGARHVVVAGGAVESPRLLLLSGFDHDALGRHLMVHVQTFAVGVFAEEMHGERGRSVTHVHDDAVIVSDPARRFARQAGLPWLRGGLVEHGGTGLPVQEAMRYPWGEAHTRLMRDSPMRAHLWAFTMQGEDLAQRTNTIDLDPDVRDARGMPVARMTYRPHRHELLAAAHHGPILERVLKRMGAIWTTTATIPASGEEVERSGGLLSALPDSHHVMGTARMGHSSRDSVVDPWGIVHGTDNVMVADSSVFVTSAGYGPTLTLVALAARAARALVGGSVPPPSIDATDVLP
ncbi:MAG: GMC family oxidoreductase [Acidimicrobiales bacterium]